jgi:hypothetical protein
MSVDAMAHVVSRSPLTAKAIDTIPAQNMWCLWWTKWQWNRFFFEYFSFHGPGSVVGIATGYGAGRSRDWIPIGARFSAPVQTGPGAHPASCTIGTRSFSGVKSGRGVMLTLHPLRLGQERVELYFYSSYGPYSLYGASVPVQGCTSPFTFYFSFPVSIIPSMLHTHSIFYH